MLRRLWHRRSDLLVWWVTFLLAIWVSRRGDEMARALLEIRGKSLLLGEEYGGLLVVYEAGLPWEPLSGDERVEGNLAIDVLWD